MHRGDIVVNKLNGRYGIFLQELGKGGMASIRKISASWIERYGYVVIRSIDGITSIPLRHLVPADEYYHMPFSESSIEYVRKIAGDPVDDGCSFV